MMDDYKFLSEVTKACLPFGVTNLSEIKREEISPLLERMKDKSKRSGEDWMNMFFSYCLGVHESWDQRTILSRLNHLKSDTYALKGKLKE